MRLALVGTGRMGAAVKSRATKLGWLIGAQFDQSNPLTEPDQLRSTDVAVDFTCADAVPAHVRICCDAGLPLVVGTTGWYEHMPMVQSLIERRNGALLYSPNFSIGLQLLLRAVRAIGPLVDRFEEFDAAIYESHHAAKADRPSGTAILLADAMMESVTRKKRWVQAGSGRPGNALEIASSRVGYGFGRHSLMLDSAEDSLVLTHEAKGRAGFASGAIRAAEWLVGRRGVFTFDQMMASCLEPTQRS